MSIVVALNPDAPTPPAIKRTIPLTLEQQAAQRAWYAAHAARLRDATRTAGRAG